jgi:hypothetical protein
LWNDFSGYKSDSVSFSEFYLIDSFACTGGDRHPVI